MEWCDKEFFLKFLLIYIEWLIFIEKRENLIFFYFKSFVV